MCAATTEVAAISAPAPDLAAQIEADLAAMAADRTLFTAWAAGRGWSVDLTDTGYFRCERHGSVVLGPRLGEASCESLRELARRLVHVERYTRQHGARWRCIKDAA
jgi:hypothetical protein